MRFHGRILFLAAILTLAATNALSQNQHSNQGRGFDANGVYSSKSIDSINLFNGNLNLAIPIGGTYQVGSQLSYSFALYYNSNIWNHKEVCPVEASTDLFTVWVRKKCKGSGTFTQCLYSVEPLVGDADNPTPRGREGGGCFTVAQPNPMANAGLGWQFSLGKLFPPRFDTTDRNPLATERALWVYESPDGSEHAFYDKLHETDTAGSNVFGYTRDGSYLRMKQISDTEREVQFPDGTIHTFKKQSPQPAEGESWRLTRMSDLFGNWMAVDYGNYLWTITDSAGRTHTVELSDQSPSPGPFHYQPVVTKITLAGFGNGASVYNLDYTSAPIQRGAPHVDWDEEPAVINVPFLTSVELPDTSSYKVPLSSYDMSGGVSSAKLRGVITGIELPTGASIAWEYKGPTQETVNGVTRQLWYGYPKVSSARAYSRASTGVRKRIVHEDGDTYTWKYDPIPEPAPDTSERPECIQGEFEPTCSPSEFVTRVTDPQGNYTKNYFSVYPHPFAPNTGRDLSEWHIAEYGLPFSKKKSGLDSKQNPVFISVEYFKGSDATESDPVRSVYVRYETDKVPATDGYGSVIDTNRRLVATRTVYGDDKASGLRYSEVQYSDFDGLGHYRRVDAIGNFSPGEGRVEETSYNPGRGRFEINPVTNGPSGNHTYSNFPESSDWVLNTYTDNVVWDSDHKNGAKKEFYFSSKGLLLRQRTLKNSSGSGTGHPGQNAHDILELNEYAADATLTDEKRYGGDNQTIGLGLLSSLPVENYTPEYWVGHTYSPAKFLTSSRYKTGGGGEVGGVPYLLNQTVDKNTGLVSAVYEASGINKPGLTTTFTYDSMWRLTNISPQQGSKTVIEYLPNNSGSAGRAQVNLYKLNNAGTATLDAEFYDYDHMGRLRTTTKSLDTGVLISRRTKYNGMGWKLWDSEWGNSNLNSKVTQYLQFDVFGRPTVIRPPDCAGQGDCVHDVKIKYKGTREVERTVSVGTTYNAQTGAVSEEAASTTEYYDVLGRLRGVNEPSGTGGGQIFTGYQYDVRDRLTKVKSNGTNLTPIFEPDQITNVALAANGGQAIASSTVNANFSAASAINGDRKGAGWGQGTGGWADGTQGDYSSDIAQVNFAGFKYVSEVDLYTLRDDYSRTDEPTLDETFNTADSAGQGITHFEVQYWNGSAWLTAPGGMVAYNNKVWRRVQFPEVLASAVRVQVHGAVKWGIPNNYSRIVELEAWGRDYASPNTVWVDESLPAGAVPHEDFDNWKWVGSGPWPVSGALSHQSNVVSGWHQHYFTNATQTLGVNPGDNLFAYVYLDPANPPSEVMLQWNDGSWEHRAYWGADLLPWGANGTDSKRYMGPLPPTGQWVRLEVPASQVGMEGKVANGMAFSLWDGRATWDYAGKTASNPHTIWVDDTTPAGAVLHADQETWKWVGSNPAPNSGALSHQSATYSGWHQHYFYNATQTLSVGAGEKLVAYVYLDPANPPSEVMLQWNDGSWEHRAYWGADLLPWGANGTDSKRYMGALPETGKWVRLEVPASQVGLEGHTLNGMAFSLYNGRATWDYAGKAAANAVPPAPRVNLARQAGATATASSQVNANYPVSAIIDGDRKGNNWGKGGYGSGWNDATQNEFSQDWLQVNFSGTKTIDEIDVFTLQDNLNNLVDPTLSMTFSTGDNTGYGLTDYEVQYRQQSTGKWVSIPNSDAHVTGNNKVWRKFEFPAVSTDSIRVVVHGAVRWSAIPNNYSRIVEVEAYSAGAASFTSSSSTEQTTSAATTGVTQERSFTYDNRGFLSSETHPELGAAGNGTITYTSYDTQGNVGYKNDGKNYLHYIYDPVTGRLTQVDGFIDDEPDDTTPDSTPPQWRPLKEFSYYDNNDTSAVGYGYGFGKIQNAKRHNYHTNPYNSNFSDQQVTDNYRYKGVGGRVSRRETSFSSGASFVQSYTYTDLGDILTLSYPELASLPASRQLTYSYANGMLDNISNGGVNYANSITYHDNGMLASFTHANGVQDIYGQDPNRMQRISAFSTAGVANGFNLADGPYSYDGAGNITKIASNWYLYDKVQRVKEGATVNGTWKQQYDFDIFGNIPKITTTRPGQAPTVVTLEMNAATNRFGGNIQYDAAGNVLGVSATSIIHRYDAFNMLKHSPDKVYFYDANDQRVQINDNPGADPSTYLNTFTLRGPNNEVLREYLLGAAWTWQKDYIYMGGKLISSETAGAGRLEYHTDHLGVPRMITNSSAQQMAVNHFFPFGEQAFPQTENWYQRNAFRLKFTGHERDVAFPGGHLLDYMHARFYMMSYAKFINVDPGRDSDTKHPQSWNLYAYVRNNPINRIDPDGRQTGCANDPACGNAPAVRALMEAENAAWASANRDGLFGSGPLENFIAENLTPGGGAKKTILNTLRNMVESVLPPLPSWSSVKQGIANFEKHHIFNVFRGSSLDSQHYRNFFASRNIDIHQFAVEVETWFHRNVIHGKGGNFKNWTNEWKKFIDANPAAELEDVLIQAEKMMKDYGIDDLPFINYFTGKPSKGL